MQALDWMGSRRDTAAPAKERGGSMVFKVNYRQQRSERNRVKQAKKEAKLREREEAAARRKLEAGEPGEPGEATQGIAETDAE
jgi:hypothetical protein